MSAALEAQLRPAAEIYSGIGAASAASLAALYPSLFLMATDVAYGTAVVLAGFSIMRLRQGIRIVRYQKNLKRQRRYEMSAEELPCYRKSLFLGRGFEWTQIHTQRLRNTFDPRVKKYIDNGPVFEWARHLERRNPDSWLARLTSWDSPLNPVRPLPPVGGNPALHGVSLEEKDLFMPLEDRRNHALVLGATGMGKTQLEINLITQDIRRADSVVVCFDPKGSSDLLEAMYQEAERCGRLDEFYVMHLGYPELSARWNGISDFNRITEIATRVANQLPGEGDSAVFRDFSWLFITVISRALADIGERPTYELILRAITDLEPLFRRFAEHWLVNNSKDPMWQADVNGFEEQFARAYEKNPKLARFAHPRTEALLKYVEETRVTDPVIHGLVTSIKYNKEYYSKLVASTIPYLQKLTTGAVGELLSPDYLNLDDPRPIWDWPSLIRQKGIIYIGLDALADQVTSSAVGGSLFASLLSTAATIYLHGQEAGQIDAANASTPKIMVHADEFNELISDSFLPLINKAASAGVYLTCYTQSRSDLEAGIGSKAKAGVIESNFGTLISLRVRTADTAQLMTDMLGKVNVSTIMTVSGATDNSNVATEVDFVSSTQDRVSTTEVPLLEPSALMSLPKGQAFALLNGSRLFKLRIPLPKNVRSSLPDTLSALTQHMRREYRSSERWWQHG